MRGEKFQKVQYDLPSTSKYKRIHIFFIKNVSIRSTRQEYDNSKFFDLQLAIYSSSVKANVGQLFTRFEKMKKCSESWNCEGDLEAWGERGARGNEYGGLALASYWIAWNYDSKN